jgi:hypothetical protein
MLMAVRFVPMMFGGLLMGLAWPVACPHGRLLVRGCCSAVSATGIFVTLRGRMVRLGCAHQRLLCTQLRTFHGLPGHRQSIGQIGSPLLQLPSAGAGAYSADSEGAVVLVVRRLSGHIALSRRRGCY